MEYIEKEESRMCEESVMQIYIYTHSNTVHDQAM